MDGSRTIRVVKRDGSVERFDPAKLASSIWRVMQVEKGCFNHARQLAEAIGAHLVRRSGPRSSSRAVFEMTVKALRYVGLSLSADLMERHRSWRQNRRNRLQVRHENGMVTLWDKAWLKEFTVRSWHISPRAARIIATEVEQQLLSANRNIVLRQEVLEMLNCAMAEYGLADAVPVQQVD